MGGLVRTQRQVTVEEGGQVPAAGESGNLVRVGVGVPEKEGAGAASALPGGAALARVALYTRSDSIATALGRHWTVPGPGSGW